ncbi:MAG: alanine racemase [Microbacteriaceae bacterium]|nr:alanine racemase [Microbacteriaceae bacterium]
MSGGTEIVVDLDAYRANLATLETAVAPAGLMAVVKADAYGHGLIPMARAAVESGITWIGALDLGTGLELRSAGIGREISIFAWLLGPDEDYRTAINAGIDLGVSTIHQLNQVADAGARTRARLHLKIDTGLHRNGASEQEWPTLVRRALELEREGIAEVYAAWTHIAEASDDEDSEAISRFDGAVATAEALGARFSLRHLAASAAGLLRSDSRFDLVRMGAFTFGISPGGGIAPDELGLVPVMTLSSHAVEGPDGSIVLPIGFGDGLSSVVAGRVGVATANGRRPIESVGLDFVQVDGLAVGDRVVFFGNGAAGEPTLQEWADSTGTIGEEIVTRLGKHLYRSYLGD